LDLDSNVESSSSLMAEASIFIFIIICSSNT
jgi:hypothetical protein